MKTNNDNPRRLPARQDSRRPSQCLKMLLRTTDLGRPRLLIGFAKALLGLEHVFTLCSLADDQHREYVRKRLSRRRSLGLLLGNPPLPPIERPSVLAIHLGSPLELTLVFAAAIPSVLSSVWLMVQIAERVTDWRLNREKLRLEVEKLRTGLLPSTKAGVPPDGHQSDWPRGDASLARIHPDLEWMIERAIMGVEESLHIEAIDYEAFTADVRVLPSPGNRSPGGTGLKR